MAKKLTINRPSQKKSVSQAQIAVWVTRETHRKVKAYAAGKGVTLRDLVLDALRDTGVIDESDE